MPVNYQLGKIYKIVDNTNENVYVGSTCEPTLARRLAKHVSCYLCYLTDKETHNYYTSFEIIKNNDYDILLIEAFPCNSKDELFVRERHWTNTLNNCVNKCKNQGLIKEIGKVEYNRQNCNQYRIKNKEKIDQHKKEIVQCECGKHYSNAHKQRHFRTIKHLKFLQQNEL
jgi:hypothetical protein